MDILLRSRYSWSLNTMRCSQEEAIESCFPFTFVHLATYNREPTVGYTLGVWCLTPGKHLSRGVPAGVGT